MNVFVEVNAVVPCALPEKFFHDVVQQTCMEIAMEMKKIEISVALVSEDEMKMLNREYRKINDSTDVLSFGNYTSLDEIKRSDEKRIVLGEVILCCSYIENSAREQGVTFLHEMAYITSHGVLHLFGYDHEDQMFILQDKITKNLISKYT